MTQIAASTSQVTIIASNSARKGLTLYNQSASKLYISSQTGFSSANAPTVVEPNSEWTLPVPYTGALYGIWDVATGQAIVQEV